MKIPTIEDFKRGSTFYYDVILTDDTGTAVDISGFIIESEIRDSDLKLIDSCVCTILDGTHGKYNLTVADTTKWDIGTYQTDIKMTDTGGIVRYTDTFKIKVIERITIG
jgi:hypothetical protein